MTTTSILQQASLSPMTADPAASELIPPSVRIAKRIFDLAVIILCAPVALLLTPLIAAMIRLDSPGPALFRQERLGEAGFKGERRFTMLKFRTMRVDAERTTGAVWASDVDPRITRIGRILRKTRLDEIPQLLNVLKGEMSIVGPRPERPEIAVDLEHAIPFYGERIVGVRPGITGLAQVKQGYDRDLEDVRRKILHDFRYALGLRNLTSWLWMDLRVIVETILVMVAGRGK
jgi:lipopolysaccharide/colanic/teichoic acid biosynthesis glycosyltransferase